MLASWRGCVPHVSAIPRLGIAVEGLEFSSERNLYGSHAREWWSTNLQIEPVLGLGIGVSPEPSVWRSRIGMIARIFRTNAEKNIQDAYLLPTPSPSARCRAAFKILQIDDTWQRTGGVTIVRRDRRSRGSLLGTAFGARLKAPKGNVQPAPRLVQGATEIATSSMLLHHLCQNTLHCPAQLHHCNSSNHSIPPD